ncbi:hypothetical protein NO1_1465 [Candidatus Termititenax aidoneus]|uniref:Uncharacterized protein n=1 Tax=Termititenax aidoneus TaxID=2218524 RepID=A0A388TE82_TERA1|nr:hypothetical protein NO1_1465 [Candidatus Termititenax aidoneus]
MQTKVMSFRAKMAKRKYDNLYYKYIEWSPSEVCSSTYAKYVRQGIEKDVRLLGEINRDRLTYADYADLALTALEKHGFAAWQYIHNVALEDIRKPNTKMEVTHTPNQYSDEDKLKYMLENDIFKLLGEAWQRKHPGHTFASRHDPFHTADYWEITDAELTERVTAHINENPQDLEYVKGCGHRLSHDKYGLMVSSALRQNDLTLLFHIINYGQIEYFKSGHYGVSADRTYEEHLKNWKALDILPILQEQSRAVSNRETSFPFNILGGG